MTIIPVITDIIFQTIYPTKSNNLNLVYLKFYRNDEEWLQHRQIMNNFLLKDMTWTEKLVEMTCDNFISKLKRILDSEDATVVENLEDELYLWSIYCM